MKRIALATAAKLPTLNDDDRLVIPALAELGLAAVPAVGDSPDVCWEEFQGVVVRSCWDYHQRLEEFLAWVTRLERAGVPLWNPPALLRWNSHKGYLRDLAARGVAIVQTRRRARRGREPRRLGERGRHVAHLRRNGQRRPKPARRAAPGWRRDGAALHRRGV